MKVTVTMTVCREMELQVPSGGTEHESDASAMASIARAFSDSIAEDPLLFVDSEDAVITIKVEM